jgi:hypothetical protein
MLNSWTFSRNTRSMLTHHVRYTYLRLWATYLQSIIIKIPLVVRSIITWKSVSLTRPLKSIVLSALWSMVASASARKSVRRKSGSITKTVPSALARSSQRTNYVLIAKTNYGWDNENKASVILPYWCTQNKASVILRYCCTQNRNMSTNC